MCSLRLCRGFGSTPDLLFSPTLSSQASKVGAEHVGSCLWSFSMDSLILGFAIGEIIGSEIVANLAIREQLRLSLSLTLYARPALQSDGLVPSPQSTHSASGNCSVIIRDSRHEHIKRTTRPRHTCLSLEEEVAFQASLPGTEQERPPLIAPGPEADEVAVEDDQLTEERFHTNDARFLEEVFALSSLGLRVLPVREGSKQPRQKRWQDKAASDERVLKRWPRRWRRGNLGSLRHRPWQGTMMLCQA